MRALLLAAAVAMSSAAAAAQGLEKVRTPEIVKVGKWAEGVAFDGTSLWVAESGQRSLARIAANRSIVRHDNVGRLPVGMAATADGRVFALVQTDQTVWQIKPGSPRGQVLAWIPQSPVGLAVDARSVWVLTWVSASSADSRVYRVDAATGVLAETKNLGEWGQTIAAAHGKVWVGHVRGQRLNVVDPTSLAVQQSTVKDVSSWAIVANRAGLYVGGRIGDDNGRGVVVAIDPATLRETARATVNSRIAAMAATDEVVVAIGENGAIWSMAPQDLAMQSAARLDVGPFRPSSALIHGDRLVVVAQQYQGENGAVFTLAGWR